MEKKNESNLNSRRNFLGKVFMSGGIFASLILMLRNGLAFVFPKETKPKSRKLLVGRTHELELGEAKQFSIGKNDLFLVNTNNGYKVYSAVCTHLGCKIKWEAHRNRFYCACHKGIFDSNGDVVGGPPPRALDEYTVEISNSLVYMWMNDDKEDIA
jgi:Rieske Fe-S protein